MSMNSYVSDELANKVQHLHSALSQAQNIITTLEKENNRLYDVLVGLTSNEQLGYILNHEVFNESVRTVL
jgi:hypothetical protein